MVVHGGQTAADVGATAAEVGATAAEVGATAAEVEFEVEATTAATTTGATPEVGQVIMVSQHC